MSGCLGVYINVCVYDEHGLQVILLIVGAGR